MGVPLARRSLFESRARVAIATGGVALAMLLVLALDAVFAGAMRGVTAYMDNTDFDVVVSQEGVRNLHMTSSQFPLAYAERIGRVAGVDKADPILFTSAFLKVGDSRNLAYLIGYEEGGLGGPANGPDIPRKLRRGEIVIDRRVAEENGVSVGDTISALGRDFTVAGLVSGTVSITNSVAYIGFDDFESAARVRRTASFVLVRTASGRDPEAVAHAIRDEVDDLTVQTKPEFAASERRIISDMSTDILRFMSLVGFLIGLAVVGLTVYTATIGKIHEYGVLKAIGAPTARLFGVVFGQALMSVVLGLAAAVSLTLVLSLALALSGSAIRIVLETPSVVRVAAGAAVIATAASAVPILRVARIEPSDVFRR